MKTIDACGISCPEPLLRLKKALETEQELILLADSKNAMQNCVEYAHKQNCHADTVLKDGIYRITVQKSR